jgi:hypothetical protein
MPPRAARCNRGMFIGDEARAAIGAAAATARLANLAAGGSLIPASYAAWEPNRRSREARTAG